MAALANRMGAFGVRGGPARARAGRMDEVGQPCTVHHTLVQLDKHHHRCLCPLSALLLEASDDAATLIISTAWHSLGNQDFIAAFCAATDASFAFALPCLSCAPAALDHALALQLAPLRRLHTAASHSLRRPTASLTTTASSCNTYDERATFGNCGRCDRAQPTGDQSRQPPRASHQHTRDRPSQPGLWTKPTTDIIVTLRANDHPSCRALAVSTA